MHDYKVTVSQAGGEYYGDIYIKGNWMEKVNVNKIIIDGIEIVFHGEYIENIEIVGGE